MSVIANCPFCGLFPDEFSNSQYVTDGSGWTIRCLNTTEGCPQPSVSFQYKKQSRAAWNGRAVLRWLEKKP